MKKILCFLSVCLLASCFSANVDTTEIDSLDDQAVGAEVNMIQDGQDINSGQESIGDIPSLLQNLPDVYMKDQNFKFCVAQNVDACVSDFKYQNPDITSCDDFITESGRGMCKATELTAQAREAESMSLCESLPTDGAQSCKNEVAVTIGLKTGELDSCSELSESYINECKNQIILSNAIKARDESICDGLILEEEMLSYEKDFCTQEIQMQLENDEYEKEQLEEQERMQKEQEAQIAEEEKRMADEEARLIQEEAQ